MAIAQQLAQDTIILDELNYSHLLLMKNACVPWFILVPKTQEVELVDLPWEQQTGVLKEINLVSQFIREHFRCDKLNTAAIGNQVSQLHIHVVGRCHDDPYWPSPVWGQPETKPYTKDRVLEIQQLFRQFQSNRMV